MDCNMMSAYRNVCCCGMIEKDCTYKKYNTCTTNKIKLFLYKIIKYIKQWIKI